MVFSPPRRTMIRTSTHGAHTLDHIHQQKLCVFQHTLQLLWMPCLKSGHEDPWRTAFVIVRPPQAPYQELKLKLVRAVVATE